MLYLHQFNIKLNWVLMTFWAPQSSGRDRTKADDYSTISFVTMEVWTRLWFTEFEKCYLGPPQELAFQQKEGCVRIFQVDRTVG